VLQALPGRPPVRLVIRSSVGPPFAEHLRESVVQAISIQKVKNAREHLNCKDFRRTRPQLGLKLGLENGRRSGRTYKRETLPRPETAGHQFGGLARLDLQAPAKGARTEQDGQGALAGQHPTRGYPIRCP
jgi:hypothetical protein